MAMEERFPEVVVELAMRLSEPLPLRHANWEIERAWE